MAKKVVVVRVGEKTTHIVHMESGVSAPTVYGCVRVPTPENAVEDGAILDVIEVARRIKRACQEKGIRTKDVIFTIASSKIASRETVIPAVAKAKLQQVVMAKVPDMFPVDMDKYIFAYQLQGKEWEDGEDGKVRDVRVFAAPSELVESYYALADACGFHIVSVDADGNGIFQIMRRQVREGVTMAIQVNQNSTLINVITSEKLLLQRVVPYGVNVFAETMMQEEVFQAETYEKAYQILTTQRVLMHNLNASNPQNDFSVEKRIEVTDSGEFLISNISRVIEYYNTRYKEQPILNIICTGQGCSVAGLHELMSNELGIPVVTPNELHGIRFNRKITIDAAILQYLNCFGSVFEPVRFVPKEIANREAKKGSLTGAVLIFASLMLLSVVLAGLSVMQVVVATEERDAMQSRYNALIPIERQYDELSSIENNYSLSQLIENYTDTNNNHFHELITKLSGIVPKSFRIQSVQSDEEKVTISATTADRLSSLSELRMQLNKLDNIEKVWIDEIAETRDDLTGRRQYTYTLTFQYKKLVASTNQEVQ